MTDRELFEKVLEAIDHLYRTGDTQVFDMCYAPKLIPALRERLAQPEQPSVPWSAALESVWGEPEQEPVAWFDKDSNGFKWRDGLRNCDIADQQPLYTTPPQRKPLTPQSPCEMTQAEGRMFKLGWLECEAAHGIKGDA